ncbi:zinc ribbon domain-containing protein [Butyrivibrio sp. AE2032]|uniref:zinc ribbon domain-containing protein n=1 Tax=Butyrivibrio sp. AE2032 TaxID=1458463 RepID=UPI0006916919|nr:zinc ribbon domain-containing protein [Butyrivibrio sp. AE2032]
MSFCPNCGAENIDGAKFCGNCGGALAAAQPAQPVYQPVQEAQPAQPVYQPVQEAQPVQPVYQPVQEAQPVQPDYQQPIPIQPVQPVYAQPIVPPVSNRPKTNSLCKTGFILSLVGLACIGLTCPIGLILCVIGLFSSSKKKEGGKGLAIAGIIISSIIIVSMTFYFITSWDEFTKEFDFLGGITPVSTTTDDDDDRKTDYKKIIEKNSWIAKGDQSYLVFTKKDKSFTYYQSYFDLSDNYYTGHYEIYVGEDAMDYITEDLDDYGVTRDELRQTIRMNDDYETENLVCISLVHEEMIVGGVDQADSSWTVNYFGFFLTPEKGGKTYNVLDIANMETASYTTFIKEDEYVDFTGTALTTSTEPDMTTSEIFETTEYTEPSDTTETTETTETSMTSESTENTTSSDSSVMGNSITGTVDLSGDGWADWYEADGQDDYYESRVMKINMNTGTIVNLSVYKEFYNSDAPKAYAEFMKQSMESEGCTDVTMESTKLGGYDAYSVSGVYTSGEHLAIWLFVDNSSRLHFVSVEYTDKDTTSYDMVKNTYKLG